MWWYRVRDQLLAWPAKRKYRGGETVSAVLGSLTLEDSWDILLNIDSRSLRLKKETGARKIQVLLEASGNWSSGYRCTCPGKRAEKRMEGNTQTSSPGKPQVLSSFHIVLALSGRRLPFPTFMYQKPILVGSKTCLRFFLLSGPIEPGTQLELSKWRVSIADTEENQEASVTYRHCRSI